MDSRLEELHQAIEDGNEQITRDLCESGVSLNCYVDGKTATAKAIICQQENIARYLLSLEPNVHNGKLVFPHQAMNENDTENGALFLDLHSGTFHIPLLILAAQRGYADIISNIISLGCDINTTDELKNQTALHVAAQRGFDKVISVLIKEKANVNKLDTQSKAPLHLAVEKGFVKLVEMLLSNGAEVNLPGHHDQLPIHTACINQDVKIVGLLLDNGCLVNNKDMLGCTPLHYAAEKQNLEIMKLLIDNKANVHCTDDMGCTVLHQLILTGNCDAVRLLLGKGKASVNQESCQGSFRKLPLQTAASKGNKDIVNILLKHGTNINARDSLYGETALHWATHAADTKMVEHLIEEGADVNAQNYPDRQTPLHIACKIDQDGNCVEIVNLLLKHRVRVNVASSWHENNEVALHIAVRRGCVAVVQSLLQVKQLDLHCENAGGDTPLTLAIIHKRCDIGRLLIESGSFVNEKKKNHHIVTAAVKFMAYRIATDLLKHGAEIRHLPKPDNPLTFLMKTQEPSQIMTTPDAYQLLLVLLTAGVDVGSRSDSSSPLAIATQAEAFDLVELLTLYSPCYPPSLYSQCVWLLRGQALVEAHGKSITTFVSSLPLPQCVKDQMCYTEN